MRAGETFLGLDNAQIKTAIATGLIMAAFGFIMGLGSTVITNYVKEKI